MMENTPSAPVNDSYSAAGWEISAVVLTGGLHLLFEWALNLKLQFLAVAVPLWALYLITRVRRDPRLLREWGFRLDTLLPSLAAASAAGITTIGIMLIYGFYMKLLPLHVTFWPVLFVYPLWGLIQQFLLNSLLAKNLRLIFSAPAAVIFSAFLFSLAHAPDLPLMGLTLIAGLIWVPIYLWRPNLWVLGLWHGFMGAAACYMVLGRDAVAVFMG